jgi:VCBS repeat-containing protein
LPATTTAAHSGNAYTDGLIYGTKWAVTTLTFSFPTSASLYGTGYGSGEPASNFEAFNATQQAAVKATLAMYSSVANIKFVQVAETTTQHGDLRYAMSDLPSTAWAYLPTTNAAGGDAWFNNSTGWYDNPITGNYAFISVVHETGHALGLKHAHEASGTFAAMPADHDSLEYTVMSYRSYVGASTTTGYTNASDSYPQTLMMYDIAAVQSLYGANYTTNAGDTLYSWSATTGQMIINGVGQALPVGNKIFLTVWDGGGVDTYDFSNYATTVSVNLQPGEWSTPSAIQLANLGNGHTAAGNIANALLFNGNPASLIENAIGGSAGDTIIGNAANNKLTGKGGNDGLDGLGGTNTAVYSGTHLQYSQVQNANGTWTITDLRAGSPDGIDTLANIQFLQFSDGVYAPTSTIPVANRAPAAVVDAYATGAGVALAVAAASGVLANDSDPDGNTMSAALVTGPAHGTLSLAADGSFTYTPTTGWSGADSFTYQASDGSLTSAPTTVSLTVNPPANRAPVAQADAYATGAGVALTVAAASGVLANDSDPDGNAISAALVTGPAHGTLSLAANGSFTYTPTAGWSGADSFTYRASDGSLTSSATTVNLTVSPVNRAPVAQVDAYSTTAAVALAVATTSGVLANDSDPDGNALSAALVTGPAHGTLSLAANGSFVYTPTPGWVGADSFTYRASDGALTSSATTVSLTVQPPLNNVPPAAGNDEYAVNSGWGQKLVVNAANGLLANDSDANGNPMTVKLVQGPSSGTLQLNADGSFTYTPALFNSTKAVTFQYQTSDGYSQSVVATATIDIVSSFSPAPQIDKSIIVQNDTYAAVRGQALSVDAAHGVLANDSDREGEALSASLVSGSANGTVSFASDGSFNFTPLATFTGTTSFTYRVTDGNGVSTNGTATITVAAAAAAPALAGAGAAADLAAHAIQPHFDLDALFGSWGTHAPATDVHSILLGLLFDHAASDAADVPDDMPAPAPEIFATLDPLHLLHTDSLMV